MSMDQFYNVSLIKNKTANFNSLGASEVWKKFQRKFETNLNISFFSLINIKMWRIFQVRFQGLLKNVV